MKAPVRRELRCIGGGKTTSDWRAELRGAVRSRGALQARLPLIDDERAAIDQLERAGGLPLSLTPHALGLIDPRDPDDPLRRQLVPRAAEFAPDPHALDDPLGEVDLEAVPHLVHRYPDRVLLLVTDRCASYCRFCTRKRLVGQGPTPTLQDLDAALAYIRSHPEIVEVILSGGDALMLSNPRLAQLFEALREIPHIEIIRVATRMLTFVPSRIDAELIDIARAHAPVYFLVHFNHPRELSAETCAAIGALVDAGLPVLNQTVLLAGINDDVEVLRTLFRHLTRLRARPYYLHQVDLAPGTAQFRVPLQDALELVRTLRESISGISMPTFVLDVPGGKGKVPLFPGAILAREGEHVVVRGHGGDTGLYPTDIEPPRSR